MKRIIALMKFDLTNAFRDSMVIYIFLAALLLAMAVRIFLPSFEGSVVTFAVEVPGSAAEAGTAAARGVAPTAASFPGRLEAYGRVELYGTREEVRERVLATDDVGGLVRTGDPAEPWKILLEGNEESEATELMQAVFHAAANPARQAEYTVSGDGTRSPFKEYASVALAMLASLIGGLAVAFSMIDEKEQGVTRAFSVTPLSTAQYFMARGLLAALIGFLVATIGHFILAGTSIRFERFLLALVVSAPLPLVVTLLVGGIAKNQIQAVATLKVVMMIYLTVPFVSIAVPRAWHWVFYPFANYWMFRSFEDVYVSTARVGDLPTAAAITALAGLVTLGALGGALSKQLKPQRGIHKSHVPQV